ncbi:MAG: hypothetical protein ABII25_02725, partial [bacterium]
MNSKCLFCKSNIGKFDENSDPIIYSCDCCGSICLAKEAFEDFEGVKFSEEDKNSICTTLRNEWESNG